MTEIHVMSNAIITFRDKDGREWSAAAHVGPLMTVQGKRASVPFTEESLRDLECNIVKFQALVLK